MERVEVQNRIQFLKLVDEGEEDRISALPDCVLIEILSRLPSTKNAIRTGTLSKRWKHLWTLVPTLIFTYSDYSMTPFPPKSSSTSDFVSVVDETLTQNSDFVSFVDKTLTQCRQLKLNKFEVHTHYIFTNTNYDIRFKWHVNNWIRYAVSCNVEELNLEFVCGEEAEVLLDQFIFVSSYFTDLTLQGCIFNPIGAIDWKNLRSLSIFYGKLDEAVIENILSGSPLLETLVLDNCSGYRLLNITSKSVKKLVCSGYYEFTLDQSIFINTCFADLTLQCCMLNPIGAISWKNLRSLSISNGKLDEDLIENILSGSPVLETLVLEDCYGFRRLDITSKSVKKLVFSGYIDPEDERDDLDDIIEINAPNILSLTINGHLLLWKLLLVNVSSLVEAKLYYRQPGHYETTPNEAQEETLKEAQEEMLKGLILNLLHVKELKIGNWWKMLLSRLEAKGFVSPSNVKFPDDSCDWSDSGSGSDW